MKQVTRAGTLSESQSKALLRGFGVPIADEREVADASSAVDAADAIGYPVVTWVGHLINLSGLVLLAGVLYAAVLLATSLFTAIALRTPESGRALLRDADLLVG